MPIKPMHQFIIPIVFAVLSTVLLPPAHSQSTNSDVSIRTDFEGGRLGEVTQVSENYWQGALLGESDAENRNRQASWYYFRVDGSKDQPLTRDGVERRESRETQRSPHGRRLAGSGSEAGRGTGCGSEGIRFSNAN